jgi:hypothetical protein
MTPAPNVGTHELPATCVCWPIGPQAGPVTPLPYGPLVAWLKQHGPFEKLVVAQVVKKFCFLWDLRFYWSVHKSPPLVPALSHINPIHPNTVIFKHSYRYWPSIYSWVFQVLFLQVPLKWVFIYSVSHANYASLCCCLLLRMCEEFGYIKCKESVVSSTTVSFLRIIRITTCVYRNLIYAAF